MLFEIIKGFLIGICASAPIGPVAIYVLQRSLGEGHKSGFLAGMGSTLVDTLYATIAIFAFAFAESFINTHKVVILVAGGVVLLGVGISLAMRDPFRKLKPEGKGTYHHLKSIFQSALLALSNPGAIFVMLALFAFFGVKLEFHDFRVAPVLLAVSSGSAVYWFIFSWIFSHLRDKIKLGGILWVNRISGIIIMIIGISLLAEGIMKIAFA